MKLSSIRYALRDALRSLWRNKYMSLASAATVAISLIILGAAWLLVINADYLAAVVESELEVNVYLNLDLEREKALGLKDAFAGLTGVEEVTFVPKEEGLKTLEERFGEEANLLEALGDNNPLPDMYRIKAVEATQVPRIAQEAENIQEVEKVRYGQGMVERLLALTQWLRAVGVVIIIAIALAAVFLISTTIRITVFARRREITIMKLVGATNWYIRWPFFLEGMIIGLLGALVAVACLNFCYSQLSSNIALTIDFLNILTDTSVIYEVYRNLLIMGTVLGAIGSAISLRKFLKV